MSIPKPGALTPHPRGARRSQLGQVVAVSRRSIIDRESREQHERPAEHAELGHAGETTPA